MMKKRPLYKRVYKVAKYVFVIPVLIIWVPVSVVVGVIRIVTYWSDVREALFDWAGDNG